MVLWFYGLSGSGKTHTCNIAKEFLTKPFIHLDSDDLRDNLWKEVGLSKDSRIENIRRITYLVQMLKDRIDVIVSASSPFKEQREFVLDSVPETIFILVDTPLEVCKERKMFAYRDVTKKVEEVDINPTPVYTINGTQSLEETKKHVQKIIEDSSSI